jgi:mono/diheme cytochrome c family protein
MHKTWFALVLGSGLALAACASHGPPALESARASAWTEDVLPVLELQCVSCHGASAEFPFLAGDTGDAMRDTLLASGYVRLDEPPTSQLLVKGPHEGPPFSQAQADAIAAWLAWLAAE